MTYVPRLIPAKLTYDGSIAYLDFAAGTLAAEIMTGIEGTIRALRGRGVDTLEVYEVVSEPGALGQRFLSTWRVCDGVRIRP